MSRLDRERGPRSKRPPNDPGQDEGEPHTWERRSPGLEALFEGLHDDGRHSILDLGRAHGKQLRLLGRFGRTIRFAGLVPRSPDEVDWLPALRSLAENPAAPYDVVLIWDLLDRLREEERRPVLDRIAQVTAGSARLHAIIDASGSPTTRPLSYRLVDVDRVAQTAVGPPEPAGDPLLPAQVERALSPFQVRRAFTLRGGLREYVAMKES